MKKYKILLKYVYKQFFVALLLLFLLVVALLGKNRQSGNSGMGVNSEFLIILVLITGLIICSIYTLYQVIKNSELNKKLALLNFFIFIIMTGLFFF